MESTGRPPTFFSWDTQTNNANYFEREDSEFSQMETFLELTSELQINQLVQYGHQIDWMLLDCSFMGKECSPRCVLTTVSFSLLSKGEKGWGASKEPKETRSFLIHKKNVLSSNLCHKAQTTFCHVKFDTFGIAAQKGRLP